jgi:N-methylhydantoinase B
VVDVAASDALRARLRAEREAAAPGGAPFFDRGPGYARLSPDGSPSSPYDHL